MGNETTNEEAQGQQAHCWECLALQNDGYRRMSGR
jgi:hypothetical protein